MSWEWNILIIVIISGLDAAGKTTILYWLKFEKAVTAIPTVGRYAYWYKLHDDRAYAL